MESEKFFFHVDLDAFFASVAILEHPEYEGVPLIIGANPKRGKGRGVVSTCSYEAREYGIHSGMPISQAWERCPFGIYTYPSRTKIKEISMKVMNILKNYSDIQQVSIDEAYLNISNKISTFQEAYDVANKIKNQIQTHLRVTCSVGIAFSKTLAKIASDINKPNGITVLTPNNYKHKLGPLSITRIPGIGKKTRFHYERRGFKTINDLYQTSLSKLITIFAYSQATWLNNTIHGINKKNKINSTTSNSNSRKSISKETTFPQDIKDINIILNKISILNSKLHTIMHQKNLFYKTISIKIRFKGFETYTRAKSSINHRRNEKDTYQDITQLLEEFIWQKKEIRLIGLKFSNFKKKESISQKSLLSYFSEEKIFC